MLHSSQVAAHQSASTLASSPLSSTSLLRTTGISPSAIPPSPQHMSRVAHIAAGFHHTVMLTRDGHVYTCGRGTMGACGHGVFTDVYYPQRVMALPVHDAITHIACGQHHTVALSTSGHVWTWGMNRHGQLCRPASHAHINYHTRRVDRRAMIDAQTCPVPACIDADIQHLMGEGERVVDVKAGFYDTGKPYVCMPCMSCGCMERTRVHMSMSSDPTTVMSCHAMK